MDTGRELPELPITCWQLIISYLDSPHYTHQPHRDALSTVCRRLLSVTSDLPFSLSISAPLLQLPDLLTRLLARFPNLDALNFISFSGDLSGAIFQLVNTLDSNLQQNLSSSSTLHLLKFLFLNYQPVLPLQGLQQLALKSPGLRVLDISNVSSLDDVLLNQMTAIWPLLEEINIKFDDGSDGPITDIGIRSLVLNLKGLKRVNFSGNPKITDQSLIFLCNHCSYVTHIEVVKCNFITEQGIAYVFRHCKNLLLLITSCVVTVPHFSIAADSMLTTLEFYGMSMPDSLLHSVAHAHLPLKIFSLIYCQNFTPKGIRSFLLAYPDLRELSLVGVFFVTDLLIRGGSEYKLRKLIKINLSSCPQLTGSALQTLLSNCPLLEEIQIEETKLGLGDWGDALVVGFNIHSLKIASNKLLGDDSLEIIGHMCPNVVHLDVRFCDQLTSNGIRGVLKSCHRIKHLEVALWTHKFLFGSDFGDCFPSLEWLDLFGSSIGDVGLSSIANACPNLQYLNLAGCEDVMREGLEILVERCTSLREINLMGCVKVDYETLVELTLARRSLRKIVAPGSDNLSESERDFFTNHGCLVYWVSLRQ